MGLGRAWSGSWNALLVLVLMGSLVALCSRMILRELRMSRAKTRPDPASQRQTGKAARVGGRAFAREARRIEDRKARKRRSRDERRGEPRSARGCARRPDGRVAVRARRVRQRRLLVADHASIPSARRARARRLRQAVAETGRLPKHTGASRRAVALRDLRLQTVAEEPEFQPISSRAQEEQLERDLAQAKASSQPGSEYAGVAASQPPLYYAIEAIPYSLGSGGTLLDRIELMRLTSALMAGLTALFTFLFVREALPRAGWAWLVGGLGVALVPLLGFMSGAVNPDSMLYAVTAAIFYSLARAFRRGLTRSSALVLGALVAVGLLTKLNFVGIAPGVLLGLIVLSVRAARTQGRAAYVSLALALTLALSPVALYVAHNLATGAPVLALLSGAIGTVHAPLAEISYIWRLSTCRGYPACTPTSRVPSRPRRSGSTGTWACTGGSIRPSRGGCKLALLPAGVIAGLCLRELLAHMGVLRARVLSSSCTASSASA